MVLDLRLKLLRRPVSLGCGDNSRLYVGLGDWRLLLVDSVGHGHLSSGSLVLVEDLLVHWVRLRLAVYGDVVRVNRVVDVGDVLRRLAARIGA